NEWRGFAVARALLPLPLGEGWGEGAFASHSCSRWERLMLTISADRLTKVASDIFRAAGATPENNECVTSALVGANLAGHDSHGILRIPTYVNDIKRGRLDPKATPEVVQETGATATIDGGSTFGQVGARASADLAIDKARSSGLAAVTA